MPNTTTSPEFVAFSAVPIIEAAASEKDLPRFSMVAYSGGMMRVDGFPHPVVVDLMGLDVPSQSVPIRLDHKPGQGAGHATRIEARAQLIRLASYLQHLARSEHRPIEFVLAGGDRSSNDWRATSSARRNRSLISRQPKRLRRSTI